MLGPYGMYGIWSAWYVGVYTCKLCCEILLLLNMVDMD